MSGIRVVAVLTAAVLIPLASATAAETTTAAQPAYALAPDPPGFPGSFSPEPGVSALSYPSQASAGAVAFDAVEPSDRRVSSQAEWPGEGPALTEDDLDRSQLRSFSERGSPSDQYPTFNWSGFLQVDAGWWIQDDANEATVGHIGDRTGLRRARLRAYGNTRRTTAYVVDLDFAASGHPSFRDVALTFHEFPLLQNVYFGYFQQPFSMDAMTSGQELLFLERRLPFAFAPFRQTGLGANGTNLGERVQWAVSVYRFPTDDFGRSIGSSGGYGAASRVTFLPWYQDAGRRLLHIGVGYSYGDPGDNLVRYQIQPGFYVADTSGSAEGDGGEAGVPVFVDTGDIPTHNYNLFNAELAANFGPLHLQSEVTFSVVDQRGGPTVGFSGAYAQMGYYLTGESRPYERKTGVFGHARPFREFERRRRGYGAWEGAAGWSYIDLNDKNIQGGSLNEYTLSLNWYLNPLTKLMANYTHAFLRDPDVGPSEAKVLGLRAQFKF